MLPVTYSNPACPDFSRINYFKDERTHRCHARFTLAHLARWAAAILRRAAADIVRLRGVETVGPFCRLALLQRAFCAARMFARPSALSLRLRRGLPAPSVYSPAKAATAALRPFNCLATLSRSTFNSASMCMQSPRRIVADGAIFIRTILLGPLETGQSNLISHVQSDISFGSLDWRSFGLQ
jgi:hypothetical protein